MEAPVINGKPAVWIQVSAAEKVNVGNFSNVDIGPISYGKWHEDLEDLKEVGKQIAFLQEFVEILVAEERQKVLDGLKGE